jgi:hypothetical protein
MRVLLAMAAAAVISIGASARASAADITWAACVDETGRPSDVLAGGTLIAAVTAGQSSTVNGVHFVGPSSSSTATVMVFGAAPITLETVQNPYGQYGAPPATWNAGYRSLVSGGAYSEYPTSPTKIQLTGLTVGDKYVVQIFEAFWNSNFATVFVGGQSSSGAVSLSGPATQGSAASGTAQYVVGTFIADSDHETISLTSTTGYVIFDAIQVRDMGAPSAGNPQSKN